MIRARRDRYLIPFTRVLGLNPAEVDALSVHDFTLFAGYIDALTERSQDGG